MNAAAILVTPEPSVYPFEVHGRARRRAGLVLAAVLLAGLVAGCGGDDDSGSPTTTSTDVTVQTAPAGENACPVEGCKITITKVVPEADELRITWKANFTPDASRNHIHVYWDTYTAEQVSNDAASRGVDQGEWVPTDAYPEYVTEGATSVTNRADSATLCVTAGDSDHNVIDSSIVDCSDVADLL
jgi:hypothetical protein